MKPDFRSALLLLLCTSLLAGAAVAKPDRNAKTQSGPRPKGRPRIAVLDFDFGATDRRRTPSGNVGLGVASVLISYLVEEGTYQVVERKLLEQVLREQDLTNSRRVDPKTALELGRLLGVEAIIVGAVTQFGLEDKNFRIGGLGGSLGGIGIGGIGQRKSRAVCVVDARIIDTTTGEVLAVASAKGVSRRSRYSLRAGGGSLGGFGGVNINFGSSRFQRTILGQATRKCVEQLGAKLVGQANRIAATKFRASGKVADVDGNTLILNLGRNHGIQVGDLLRVRQVVRVVTDPDTGEPLREVTEDVGTVRITEVDARSSVGIFFGSPAPKVGDRVSRE